MSAKRDGATLSVPKEEVAWELVRMICSERERSYVEQESKLRSIVDAYRLTTGDWENQMFDQERPTSEGD